MSLQHIRGYKMSNQYAERVSIKTIEPLDVQQITCVIQVQAKKEKLLCFSSDFSYSGPFFLDTEVHVFLSLMTTQYKVKEDHERKKTIQSYKKPHTPNHCNLTGQLVDIVPIVSAGYSPDEKIFSVQENPYFIHAIVDCGFFIAVELPRTSNPHIGDFITAEGRLDIRIARERKEIMMNKLPVNCFVDDYTFTFPVKGLERFSILHTLDNYPDNFLHLKKGKSSEDFILLLSVYGLKKSEAAVKYIEIVGSDFSKICGRVQEFVPMSTDLKNYQSHYKTGETEWQYIVLDCGIPIIAEVSNYFPFVPGDFLEVTGQILVRTTIE